VWLSEGFATYFAALFARHAHGDSAFQSAMARIRERVLEDRDAVPLRPVIDTAQTDLLALLNRNSYEKGGFVLHMLRREVGDSAFFRALRAYYAAHRDGNALTDDLRLAMEKAAGGTRLDWFFDQWLRRPGYPEVDVTWSYDPSSQQVAVDVVQASRFGAYRFPLTLRLRAETGRPGVGVVQVVTISVPAEPRARLVLPGRLLAPPLSVDADPGVELLARIQVHPN
jgi:aminopeptidase N